MFEGIESARKQVDPTIPRKQKSDRVLCQMVCM